MYALTSAAQLNPPPWAWRSSAAVTASLSLRARASRRRPRARAPRRVQAVAPSRGSRCDLAPEVSFDTKMPSADPPFATNTINSWREKAALEKPDWPPNPIAHRVAEQRLDVGVVVEPEAGNLALQRCDTEGRDREAARSAPPSAGPRSSSGRSGRSSRNGAVAGKYESSARKRIRGRARTRATAPCEIAASARAPNATLRAHDREGYSCAIAARTSSCAARAAGAIAASTPASSANHEHQPDLRPRDREHDPLVAQRPRHDPREHEPEHDPDERPDRGREQALVARSARVPAGASCRRRGACRARACARGSRASAC